MKLTRQVAFSSGHRYWLPHLSEAGNRALFGAWASPYNHGHNYVLEVTVSGRVDDRHGMVVNIKDIDDVLKDRVVSRYDQKSLNDEVDEFKGRSTSTEFIALTIRDILKPVLPNEVRLENVRVYENPLLFVDAGEGEEVRLTRVYEFAASHRLDVPSLSLDENVGLFGKCNNAAGHGHNYILEVTVSGTPDATTGMIADLGTIDKVVEDEVVGRYDHKHLNEDIPEFKGVNPTTEVVTRMIWRRLNGKLPAMLQNVLVRETARNIFEYSGEDE
ncbi:MAG: 6-carboxytetrahydropterin synthase [Fimbriimonadales bacterium]